MAILVSRIDSSGNFSIANTGFLDEVTGLIGKTTQQGSDGTHLIAGIYDEVTLYPISSGVARRQYSNGDYFIAGIFDEISGVPFNYFVTPSITSVNEGSSVTFNVYVPNFGSGIVYYTNSGTTSSADFSDGVNSGTISIINDNGAITKTLTNDNLTEGSETIIFQLRTGSTSGPIVATASTVTVADTSTATYAGASLIYNFTGGDTSVLFSGVTMTGYYGLTTGNLGTYSITNNNGYGGGANGGGGSRSTVGSSGGGTGGAIGGGQTADNTANFSQTPHIDVSGLNAAVTGAGYDSTYFGDGGSTSSPPGHPGLFAGGGGGGAGGHSSFGDPAGAGARGAVVVKYTAFGTDNYTIIDPNVNVSGTFTFPSGTTYVKIWAIGKGASGTNGGINYIPGRGGRAGGVAYCEFFA